MRKILFTLIILLSFSDLFAQKGGPIVFTVDSDTIWGAEFERVFNKNNKNPDVRPSQQELDDYLKLYVRFKLKVKEAYASGMAEDPAFQKELAGYRKQLAQPYLTDKSVTDHLIKEAYDRMMVEVNASNLMIHLPLSASPTDTLAAWNRINNWYNLISSGTSSFEQMARDSSTDDHGREHEGKLGYFTAFNMIYSFETKAYTTEIGAICKPFRTQYGYHILKVNDKRPARGDVKVAHILIRINNDADFATNKPRIDALYERVKKGESWDKLVLDFSEDFSNRERGGQLNWVTSIGGNIPEKFRETAYLLKDGEYSKPIKTELGWHIVLRKELRKQDDFNKLKETIKFKVSRDDRSELNKSAVLSRIKKENNFEINDAVQALYMSEIEDAPLSGWKPTALHKGSELLFSIGDSAFTCGAFTEYASNNSFSNKQLPAKQAVEELMASYIDQMNLANEEAILEQKYPDFRYLMQEYRDGILLFDLSNKMVWSKASEDTTGLKNFFEANRSNYAWQERATAKRYTCSSKTSAKRTKKMLMKGSSNSDILAKVNKKNALALKIDDKVFERGQDSLVDQLNWSKLNSVLEMSDASNNRVFVVISKIQEPAQKEMKEAMGPITSDYQTFLEEAWINNLKMKYQVHIMDGALDKLFIKE
ncbi:MAG: peptidyl-prolyl cis-trans isomerase SurA [Bacteroidia bacterium]|jgi:peptidyl-prolyl cis-trans isomerase SurA